MSLSVIDDILVFSNSGSDDHEEVVKEVLKGLVDNHLYVKAIKCELSVGLCHRKAWWRDLHC